MNVYKVTNITNLSKKENDLTFLDENGVSQLLKIGETKIFSFKTIPDTLRRIERLGFLLIEFVSTLNSYYSMLQETDISIKIIANEHIQIDNVYTEQIDDTCKKVKSKKK